MEYIGNIGTDSGLLNGYQKSLDALLALPGVDINALSVLIGTSPDIIAHFPQSVEKLPAEIRGKIMGSLSVLSYLSKISPDERNRANLMALVHNDGLDIGAVAGLSGVTQEEAEAFLHGGDAPLETKYKLFAAGNVLFNMLHCIEKPAD